MLPARMARPILSAALGSVLSLYVPLVFGIPISVDFGGVSLTGSSEAALGDPTCPPGASCDFRPGAKVFRTVVTVANKIQSTNPLEIELIDEFFDPLSPEEEAFLEERVEAVNSSLQKVWKLQKQKLRELRSKRSPPPRKGEIYFPGEPRYFSPDEDSYALLLEYDSQEDAPPFLTFRVSDTVTGESSTTFIDLTATSVPEPTSLALVGVALAGIGFSRRRRPR